MTVKSLLIAAALLSTAQLAGAQQQPSWKPLFGRKADLTTEHILRMQAPAPAHKGTVVTDRLTGWSIYSAGSIADTGFYSYNSTTRGSQLDNNVINSYLDFGYDPLNAANMPYPMAVSRNAPTLKYDAGGYIIFITPGSTTDRVTANIDRTYVANNISTQTVNSTVSYQGQTFPSNARQQFTYQADGNLAAAYYLADTSAAGTGSYAPAADQYYMYNGGRISSDSLVDYSSGSAMPTQRVTYAYDASNNLITATTYLMNGSTWAPSEKHSYTYTSANKLRTHLSQMINGNGITTNDVVDTFGYQGNNITYNSSYTWDDNSGTWIDGYVTTTHYNAQNDLDSQLAYNVVSGSMQLDNKTTFAYNGYGHYSRLQMFTFNGTGYNAVPDAQFNMYYETYNATAVNNVKAADLGASIFPNPATNTLSVRFKSAPAAQLTTRIYNTSGQLLQVATVNAATAQVPVAELPAGHYIIELSNNEGAQRLPFVKL